jgi:hypothetical protein
MKSLLRRAHLPAVAACLTLALRLSGADTPTVTPAAVAPVAAAVTPAPTPKVVPLQLPKALVGVVTLEEFTSLVKFQQSLRTIPEIAALNEQIRAKMNEMIELQKKAQAVQEKELEAHPDIKAISDKIKARRNKPPMVPPATVPPGTPGAAAAAPAVAPTPAAK